MSTTDNSELLAGMAGELTSTPAEREAAAEPDQDDESRWHEYMQRTSPEAPPVPHSDASGAEEDDAEAEAETDATGQRRVPLTVLQRERQKRQQLQAQLQQLQTAAQQQQAQWRAFVAKMQAAQAQQPQQAQLPQDAVDFEADPVAAHAALQAKVDALQATEALRQQMQEVAARENHVRQVVAQNAQQIASEVEPVEAAYQQENPDWPEAFDFMQRHADEAIMQRYPGMPRQQVELIKTLAIAKLHEDCRRNGTNPCALVHAEAKRLGFKAQARAAQPAAGAHQLDSLSLADVASMDDAAFDALWKDMQWSGYVQPKV